MDNDEQQLIRPKPRRDWRGLLGFQDKTLWDLLVLLGPLIISAAITVSIAITENQRAQAEQQIEDNRVRENALQSYVQDMTTLLLEKGLATAKSDSLIRQVAHANTVSAIHRLDGRRNSILLRFLSDSNLLSSESVALLRGADLSDADLSGAYLLNANLNGADLSNAFLRGAHLILAYLGGAYLSDANLSGAYLILANLSGAYLLNANLNGADLSGADLFGATGWTNVELAQARSLVGATMPDTTLMTEEAWEEFEKQYRQ